MSQKTSEEIQKLLKTIVDHFDQEDRAVRERQIKQWRQLKLYWEGFQKIWYSEIAHDWRVFNDKSSSEDQQVYDKPVNIFRAYLESIIAALSVVIPPVKCVPDDAENTLDLSTAKAGDKIAELVFKHNDAVLLWLHALYIYCTEGMIACYNYTDESEKYGTVEVNKTEKYTEEIETYKCPECGSNLDEPNANFCPNCESTIQAEYSKEEIESYRIVGKTNKPKSRQKLEVYGGLYVRVPNYAMKQEDIPLLTFGYETHYSNVLARYPELKDKISREIASGKSGGYLYDQWGRLNLKYQGEYPINNVTVGNHWIRPSAFNILSEQADIDKLNALYKTGVKVVFINDCFAEAEEECLDDHWTLTRNPLSDYLHHDPLGMLLVSVQDITNDIISLVLQTIEHGIPQTFADPNTLDFNAYRQSEVLPGSIFPAKARSGKNLAESFHEVKTASLSGEILPFSNWMNERGQLVVGALPALFGCSNISGSKTASEYSMSRAQALQRLQTPWRMLTIWWKEIFSKVIPAYIKNIMDDERFVEQDDNGKFINVYIQKAEIQGKIGSVELETSDQLPITWAQKKDIIMQLMQSNNPIILQSLMAPENLPFIKEAIGLNDFTVPGEDYRQKQSDEIQILLSSSPIFVPFDNMETGELEEKEEPSVEVDPELDNHVIESEVCRHWLVSEVGRQTRLNNKEGYRNVLLHFQIHNELAKAMSAAQPAAPPQKPLAAPLEKSNASGE